MRRREESSATYTNNHLNIRRSLFINKNITFFFSYIFIATGSLSHVGRHKYLHEFSFRQRTEISRANCGQTKSSADLHHFQLAMKMFTFENRFSAVDLDDFQTFLLSLSIVESANQPGPGRNAYSSTLLSCCMHSIHLRSIACEFYDFPFHKIVITS